MEQGSSLFSTSCAAKQVHCHHDRHGVKPEERERKAQLKITEKHRNREAVKPILKANLEIHIAAYYSV